jgi:hypothetical protein
MAIVRQVVVTIGVIAPGLILLAGLNWWKGRTEGWMVAIQLLVTAILGALLVAYGNEVWPWVFPQGLHPLAR